MGEINKETGLFTFVSTDTFKFKDVDPKAEIKYEFNFNGEDGDVHYLDSSCGCTTAFYENGKIFGSLFIERAGQYKPGVNVVDKQVNVLLDPLIPTFTGGPKKERIRDERKRWFKLKLVGTVLVP